MPKLIVITGQTATGKTKLALQYVKHHNGELINADSRQVYKYLDIITGKDKEELGKTPIHLLDLVDPKEYFSSYDFKVQARKVINDIIKRKKMPIIVGGTYLYISHLLYGIETENIKPDLKLRKELENKTVSELQGLFKKLNVDEFNKLNQSDKSNPRRLIRRIEIVPKSLTGGAGSGSPTARRGLSFRALAGWNPRQDPSRRKIDIELLALGFKKKEQLTKTIRQRVEKRLKQGAVEELTKLLDKGYKLTDPGLKTNGCKEIAEFISGKITHRKLVDRWITAEVQYAKRQYTFMKKDQNIKWISV